MRKRGVSLLLTAAMLIGALTGCGNSGGIMRRQMDRVLPTLQ